MRARNTSTDIVQSARIGFHAAPPWHEIGGVQHQQCGLQTLIVERKYFGFLSAPATGSAPFSIISPIVIVMANCLGRRPAHFRLN